METTFFAGTEPGVKMRSTAEMPTIAERTISHLLSSLEFTINGNGYLLDRVSASGGIGTVEGLRRINDVNSDEKNYVIKYAKVTIPYVFLAQKLDNKLTKVPLETTEFEIFSFDLNNIDYSSDPDPEKISFLNLKDVDLNIFADRRIGENARTAMGIVKEGLVTKKLKSVPGTTNFIGEEIMFLKKDDVCYPFFLMERIGSDYNKTLELEIVRLQDPGTSVQERIEFLERMHRISGVIDNLNFGVVEGARLIHRDIKPSNILFDDQGNPILIDYSLGVINNGTLQDGDVDGTMSYITPEQLMEKENLNTVDQYAQTLIYLELLVNSQSELAQILPRREGNVMEVINKVLYNPALCNGFEEYVRHNLKLDDHQSEMLGLVFRIALDRNNELRFSNTSLFSGLVIEVLKGNADAYRCIEFAVLNRLNLIHKSKTNSETAEFQNNFDVEQYENFMRFAKENPQFVDNILSKLPPIFTSLPSDSFKPQLLTELLISSTTNADAANQGSDLFTFVEINYPDMIKKLTTKYQSFIIPEIVIPEAPDYRDIDSPEAEIPKTLDYA